MSEPNCKMALLTQADFDGELDAAHAAEMAEHRAGCAECQAVFAALSQTRSAVRDADLRETAPESLRVFLAQHGGAHGATPLAPASGWWRWPALNFGLGAALAAGVAMLVTWSGQPDLLDLVVDDHVRALQAHHLEDVVSTDRHTVKPWFEGRIDFAPPVKDLAEQQFPLTGGRLDVLDGRPIAALVYRHGTHPINLLVWPAKSPSSATPVVAEHNGFTAVHWTQDGMTLWAVSDVERGQLEEFVRLWRAAP